MIAKLSIMLGVLFALIIIWTFYLLRDKNSFKAIILRALIVGIFGYLIYSAGFIAGKVQNGTTSGDYEMWTTFMKTVETIKLFYVDPINESKLLEVALKKMVSSLDPFSDFLTPEEVKRLFTETRGEFGGIGIQVGIRDGWITVITPIEGTPASRVGLMSGDRIVKINGESTKGWSLTKAVEVMRGKPGTKVTLTIWRPAIADTFSVVITRAIIKIKPIPYYTLLDNGIGFIRLTRFNAQTSHDMILALRELKKQGAKRFIIDLRGNPGGLLDEAEKLISIWVGPYKPAVIVKGRAAGVRVDSTVITALMDTVSPIAILVDRASASASEVFSGAIQDWDRGIIIGDTTFGKGSVQRMFKVGQDKDYYLKITIAKYYTPSGRCVHRTWLQGQFDVRDTLNRIDTTKAFYTLILKRPVYAGGGVAPDVEVRPDSITALVSKIFGKGLFFKFAVNYKNRHPGAFKKGVEITTAILKQFHDFLKKEKLDFTEKAFNKSRSLIIEYLGETLGEVYFGEKGKYDYIVSHDKVVLRARKILAKINNLKEVRDYLNKK